MEKDKYREQAEEMLARVDSSSEPGVEKMELEEILHELRVHQIEIQLQNEELKETQQELIKSRNKYHNLYNLAPVGYFFLDEDNLIKEFNQAGRNMLRYDNDNLQGKPFLLFIPPAEQENFMEFREEILINQDKVSREIELRRGNGELFFAYLTGIPADEGPGLYLALINIEERKEKEARLKYTNQALEATYKKYRKQIDQARQMHTRFLPESVVEVNDINLTSYYNPADNLGGDFYNIIELRDKLIFYIVDISGHGFDGAILNIFIREIINSYLLIKQMQNNEILPAEIIEFVARKFRQENFPRSYYICILVGLLDLNENNVYYSNAGIQIPPLFVEGENQVKELKTCGLPISSNIEERHYKKANINVDRISLKPGNLLFFTTDGLIEEEGKEGIFGLDRVRKVLGASQNLPSGVIIERIKDRFKHYTGDRQSTDDVTMFVIERGIPPVHCLEKEIVSNYKGLEQIKSEMCDFLEGHDVDRDLLMIGFHEMLVNAIEHGNSNSSKKVVNVSGEIYDHYIRIVIVDQGPGFDWQQHLDKNMEIDGDNIERERGYGIIMTHKAYDYIYYNQKGNRVTLIKLL